LYSLPIVGEGPGIILPTIPFPYFSGLEAASVAFACLGKLRSHCSGSHRRTCLRQHCRDSRQMLEHLLLDGKTPDPGTSLACSLSPSNNDADLFFPVLKLSCLEDLK
jgi:hypothetical protein